MISAITNPFLYSYFNETFKDRLKKFFALCCQRRNKEKNQVSLYLTDYSATRIQVDKNMLLSSNTKSNIKRKYKR